MKLKMTGLWFFAFFAGSIFFPSPGNDAHDPKNNARVTLTVSRVRGREFSATEMEGKFAGQKVPFALVVCDVVLDNQTGEDLVVLSHFYSAFDGLGLLLLRDGKKVVEPSYLYHQSPYSIEASPFVLKKGKNQRDMRFPIRLSPADWSGLQAQMVGSLPGSKFTGKLASNILPVQRVADLD